MMLHLFFLFLYCYYICDMSEPVEEGLAVILKHLFCAILCLRPIFSDRKPPKCGTSDDTSISKLKTQVPA